MNKDRQKIKGKNDRPRKNKDKNLTTAKKEGKIDENKENIPKIHNIIYSKNSIQFRNDNIVHLINFNGKSLDRNTESLIKVRTNLMQLFNQLKELLVTTNICIYSISKDIEILNISWLEIDEILKKYLVIQI